MYLAEQRDAAEKRKIAELIKERAEQARIEELQAHAVSTGAVKKKQERVEFLYQGHAPVDHEVRQRTVLCVSACACVYVYVCMCMGGDTMCIYSARFLQCGLVTPT